MHEYEEVLVDCRQAGLGGMLLDNEYVGIWDIELKVNKIFSIQIFKLDINDSSIHIDSIASKNSLHQFKLISNSYNILLIFRKWSYTSCCLSAVIG